MSPLPWDSGDGQARARRWERRVLHSAHPVAWPASRMARRIGPDVCFVPGLGYIVSGAELLRTILLEPEQFRKDGARSAGTAITQVFGSTALANMEGPDHGELRRTLHGLFAPRAVGGLLDRIANPSLSSWTSRLASGASIDLVPESKVLAARVVRAIAVGGSPGDMGRPAALRLHDTATELAGSLSARFGPLTAAVLRRARGLRDELLEPLEAALAQDDPSTLVGRMRHEGYSEREIRGVTGMVLVAGVETTSVALARTVAVLSDLGLWPRLRDDGSDVAQVVDEALRYVSPLPVCTRTVASSCEIEGHRMKGGRTVVCHVYNAARDARVIERGEDFDHLRPIPASLRHLWFGAGSHFCIGMALARELVVRSVGVLAGGGGVRVTSRAPSRGVLIPAYAELRVAPLHAAGPESRP